MKDKHINNLEDIAVGKNLGKEVIISSEGRDIKTIWKYECGSINLHEIRSYVLPEKEKILRYLGSDNITHEEYEKYLNLIKQKTN